MSDPPLERLRSLAPAGRAPAPMPDEAGRDELTEAGVRALEGDDPQARREALYSFGMDLRRGRALPPEVLALGLLGAAEVFGALGDFVDRRTYEALDEVCGALSVRASAAGLPRELREAFAEALVASCGGATERLTLGREGLRSLTLMRCTAGCLAPAAIDALFGLPFDVAAARHDWTVAWLAALAYRAEDQPLFSGSVPLWERFGAEHGVRLDEGGAAALRRALASERVEAALRECEAEASERYAEVAREIRLLQLDADLPARRAILLEELRAEAPSSFWSDEYGAAR